MSGRRQPAALLVIVAVATIAFVLGGAQKAIAVLAAAALISVLTGISPRLDRALSSMGRNVATVLSTAIGLVFGCALILAKFFADAFVTSPIDSAFGSNSGWYETVTDQRSANGDPTRAFLAKGERRSRTGRPRNQSNRSTRHASMASVAMVCVCAAALLVFVGDTRRSSETGRNGEIQLNASDSHSEFQKYFPDQPWAVDLVEEQSLWGWEPDPLLGWVNKDKVGRETEVVAGRRSTYRVADPTVNIWLFGGSTAFGFGQRQDYTIASQLVKMAQGRGVRIEVTNFGVSGYVNWQETQLLAKQLTESPPPDLAIFLDGSNEIALGVERDKYGLLDTTQNVRQTMTNEQRSELEREANARGYVPTNDPKVIAKLTAAQYARGVEWARRLGKQYGFEVAHFWQPQLYTISLKAPLVLDALQQWNLSVESRDLMRTTIIQAAQMSKMRPKDLTRIFDGANGPIFYDVSHTNEDGARITADAILNDIWNIIVKPKPKG